MVMYVYYKNKLIAKAGTESEKNELIKIFRKERRAYYNQLYDRIEDFLNNLTNIRVKKDSETYGEYKDFLEKNHRKTLKELELLGKEFYRNQYKGYYFQNSMEGYIGFYIETEDAYDCVPLSVLLLKCCREVPKDDDFKIIQKEKDEN